MGGVAAEAVCGVTFGGTNTFLDFDAVAGERKFMLGGSATWLGNFFGVGGDFGSHPRLFSDRQPAVLTSSVKTTGNVVLTLPAR